MLFHHYGYQSTEPRVKPAEGFGIDRPDELPDTMDVLIVGAGPAGVAANATLAAYPNVHTRMIDRRTERLSLGQADGIQARSVETFQYFGFAERIIKEAFWLTEMNFWKPNPDKPEEIIRTGREVDDPADVSEFPHLIVNQARVMDYFNEAAYFSPTRSKPNFGWDFVSQKVDADEEYPVEVTLRSTMPETEGQERVVRTKYLIGADGAHSPVRKSIGRKPIGDKADHAWGVMDILMETDFPDIRTKCAIQSHDGGSILLIPREGGFLVRLYVDLGVVPEGDAGNVRNTPLEEIIRQANEIMNPYTVDVKNVAWWSVYEVGHRVTDKFDNVDVGQEEASNPNIFIMGDACHTHSAKAGQGMNVSMQDGLNLAWKLGQVLSGYSDASLLHTYSGERQEIAQNLIDFDKEWSTLMATRPEDLPDPNYLADFYNRTFEFPAGFMTEYKPSQLTTEDTHQKLASGYDLGKRFRSFKVKRLSDANPIELGHLHEADGRWRIYVFADDAGSDDASSKAAQFGDWLAHDAASPVVKYTREGDDINNIFDAKLIYQRPYDQVNLMEAPEIFRPKVGTFHVSDLNNVFAVLSDEENIFEEKGIGAEGATVVVRPDGYVAGIFPVDAHAEVAEFFDGIFVEQN